MLQEWFAEFNGRYFGGSLPMPVLAVGRSRTRLGSLSWKYERRLFRLSPNGYTIRISNCYDLTETKQKSVLLHEMIHLYIVSNKLKDTSPHGKLFRAKMRELNADGWDIRVSERITGPTGPQTAVKSRPRVVLAVAMKDGRRLLSVVSPRYVKAIDRVIRRSSDVAKCSWYVSADDFFAAFPTVRTPKGRIVSTDTYDRLTSGMTPLKI